MSGCVCKYPARGHVFGCPVLRIPIDPDRVTPTVSPYHVTGVQPLPRHYPPPEHAPAYDGRQQPGRWCCSFHMNDVEGMTEPCAVPGCGEKAGHHLHRPAGGCIGCKAPRDHHAYVTPVLGVTPVPEGSSIGAAFLAGYGMAVVGGPYHAGDQPGRVHATVTGPAYMVAPRDTETPDAVTDLVRFEHGRDVHYEEAGVAALWGRQARSWRALRAIRDAGRWPRPRCKRRLASVDEGGTICGHTRPEHWAGVSKDGTGCIVHGCGCVEWTP